MADRVRDEAERLVAAAIAAISTAARGFGPTNRPGTGLATGSAECCVCPVCRAIAAMRDPNGDLAERLTSGVGDLATTVASILRTLAARGGRTEAQQEASPTAEGDEFWESLSRRAADAAKAYGRSAPNGSIVDDDAWRVATDATVPQQPSAPTPIAKKAIKTAVAKKAVAKTAAPVVVVEPPPPAKKVAKKAVAKKAVKKAVPPAGPRA
jgi:hypothetical protein